MACQALSDMLVAACSEATFCIAATPGSVRQSLHDIMGHPILAALPDDSRGSAELVLAEALNNIVEHAYDQTSGDIRLRLQMSSGQLHCDIFDSGKPMPNNQLPTGAEQPIASDQDLPEGGFGWFLIRALTENLSYRRTDARNHLSFQLNFEQ